MKKFLAVLLVLGFSQFAFAEGEQQTSWDRINAEFAGLQRSPLQNTALIPHAPKQLKCSRYTQSGTEFPAYLTLVDGSFVPGFVPLMTVRKEERIEQLRQWVDVIPDPFSLVIEVPAHTDDNTVVLNHSDGKQHYNQRRVEFKDAAGGRIVFHYISTNIKGDVVLDAYGECQF